MDHSKLPKVLECIYQMYSTVLLYLSDVKFPPRAPCTDDEMFGEEKTLPLSFFLQRQRAQSASRDLPFLAHWHLDQRTCGVSTHTFTEN